MIKLKVAVVLSILAFFIGLAAYDTAVSAEANKTIMVADQFIQGDDGNQVITVNHTYISNSTTVIVNRLVLENFVDFNETPPTNITVSYPLNYLDTIVVKYAEQ